MSFATLEGFLMRVEVKSASPLSTSLTFEFPHHDVYQFARQAHLLVVRPDVLAIVGDGSQVTSSCQ